MVNRIQVVCINNVGYEDVLQLGKYYTINVNKDIGIMVDEIANIYFHPHRFILASDYERMRGTETCTLKILHRSNIATIIECQSCKCTFNGTFSNIHGVPQSNPKYCIHCGSKVNNIEM